MPTVLIGADIYPGGRNMPLFMGGDAAGIFHDVLDDIRRANVSIANLECPLIDSPTPIKKVGPVLEADSRCIHGIQKADITMLSLANNHIMDHGPEGLRNTLDVCRSAGILTVGAGRNLHEARKMAIIDAGGMRFGVLAVTEHEFSIAQNNSWGANPLDLIDVVRNITENKAHYDYLIILLHGGSEYYPYPSPRLRETCRFLVEMGANAVIVQHAHCAGCYEIYRNAHIVYGQGNFVFDRPSSYPSFFEGFLIELSVSRGGGAGMTLIPFSQSAGCRGVKKMEGRQRDDFLYAVSERSRRIGDDLFLQQQWHAFCVARKDYYFFRFSSGIINNRILQKINRHIPFIEKLYTSSHMLRLENSVSCESHREVIETLLRTRRAES